MSVIFWALMPPAFLLILLFLVKKELPRIFPLTRNLILAVICFAISIASIVVSFASVNSFTLVYLAIAIAFLASGSLLPQVPRHKPFRDVLLAFAIGIGFYYTILHDPLPPGGDVWAKPYLARSAAASILSLTEPGWDTGWYYGFDYTLYGAFSPMFSGIISIFTGDVFLATRIEIFLAFVCIPPLAYLVGRRVSGSRLGGFITLIVLAFARMTLGYIGISRFWALTMLLALLLALWRWREGRLAYGASVVILLACCIFTHAQLMLMALIVFSGFSLEMLWRRKRGQFSSWCLICGGVLALSAIWWQNYLQILGVLRTTPQFFPWTPLNFSHNLIFSLNILWQMINDFFYLKLLPDIYSENYYLGLSTVFAGLVGLIVYLKTGRNKGIFPLLWAGTLVILINLPIFYSIPVLGNLLQHISYPGFSDVNSPEVKLGMQQRLMLPALIMFALMASHLSKLRWVKLKTPLFKVVVSLIPGILILAITAGNYRFAESFTNHSVSQDPRRAVFYSELIAYLKQLPPDERLYFHPSLMYASVIISALHEKPMLGGWLASGGNHKFRENIIRPLGVALAAQPQRAVNVLANLGVGTLILPANPVGRAFLANAGLGEGLLKGVYLIVRIPGALHYLYPASIERGQDRNQYDILEWGEHPGKIFISDDELKDESIIAEPVASLRQESVRKRPNRLEIEYNAESAGALGLALTYQPMLAATLDDAPLTLREDDYSGLIWFASPIGEHILIICRSRDILGWFALIISALALFTSLRVVLLGSNPHKK